MLSKKKERRRKKSSPFHVRLKIADDVPANIQNNPHVIAAYLGQPDAELDEAIEHGEAVA